MILVDNDEDEDEDEDEEENLNYLIYCKTIVSLFHYF